MKESISSIADAKRYFSDLLGRVTYAHEVIIITKRGNPIAKIIPFKADSKGNHIVDVVGKIVAPDDFDTGIKKIIKNRKKEKPRVFTF